MINFETGPASKGTVSGDTKFPAPKDKTGEMPRGPIAKMNNSSEEARNKIMRMRYSAESFSSSVDIMAKKPA